jgi:Flp pilus assembly protein TadG
METRTRSSERGTAIIEGTIVLLMFLVVLFAILEGSRLVSVEQVLTNAAREGARLSVAPLAGTSTLPTTTEIENQVNSFLQSSAIQGATVTVQRPVVITTGGIDTQFTRVRVEVPYDVITLKMFNFLEVTLSAEALMRNETSP